jgi:hypothetical protein
MTAKFATSARIGTQLEDAGFLPYTAWWKAFFERFYASGAKRFAARVGRGGRLLREGCGEATSEERVAPPNPTGPYRRKLGRLFG